MANIKIVFILDLLFPDNACAKPIDHKPLAKIVALIWAALGEKGTGEKRGRFYFYSGSLFGLPIGLIIS